MSGSAHCLHNTWGAKLPSKGPGECANARIAHSSDKRHRHLIFFSGRTFDLVSQKPTDSLTTILVNANHCGASLSEYI